MQLIQRTRVFDSGFLGVEEAVVRVGGELQRRLSVERGNSVAAVVERTDDGLVLLTRQFRYPTLEAGPGYIIELPAGVIETGEDADTCLRRELVEELGYEPEHVEPITQFYASPGASSEQISLFYVQVSARGRIGEGGGVAEEGEHIEVVAVSARELAAMLADGTLADAKTVVGALWFAQR